MCIRDRCTATARKYGLSLNIIDLHRQYWDNVVAYAIDKVKRGLTPVSYTHLRAGISFNTFLISCMKPISSIRSASSLSLIHISRYYIQRYIRLHDRQQHVYEKEETGRGVPTGRRHHRWKSSCHARSTTGPASCLFFLIDMFLSIMKSYISLNVITGERCV